MPGVSTCHLPLSPTHRVDPEGCSSVVAVGCSNITHLKLVMELMLSSGCQGVTPCPPGFAAPWGCCQGLDVVGQAWEGREGPHGGPGRVSVGGDPMDVLCSPSEERGQDMWGLRVQQNVPEVHPRPGGDPGVRLQRGEHQPGVILSHPIAPGSAALSVPQGCGGLVTAVMMAALVSSLPFIFSILFAMDIWRTLRPLAGSSRWAGTDRGFRGHPGLSGRLVGPVKPAKRLHSARFM